MHIFVMKVEMFFFISLLLVFFFIIFKIELLKLEVYGLTSF